MSRLAGLPSKVLDELVIEQKQQPGKAGDPRYSEYWDGFEERALAKRKEIDDDQRSTQKGDR